jgi:hypothetical protein
LLNKEEREEIRRRHESATPGPWQFSGRAVSMKSKSPLNFFVCEVIGDYGRRKGNVIQQREADGRFIAAAKDDIPKLLSSLEKTEAEVDRLSRENAHLRHQLEEIRAEIEKLLKHNCAVVNNTPSPQRCAHDKGSSKEVTRAAVKEVVQRDNAPENYPSDSSPRDDKTSFQLFKKLIRWKAGANPSPR